KRVVRLEGTSPPARTGRSARGCSPWWCRGRLDEEGATSSYGVGGGLARGLVRLDPFFCCAADISARFRASHGRVPGPVRGEAWRAAEGVGRRLILMTVTRCGGRRRLG